MGERFAVVLADQPHRLVFAEVAEGLVWALESLGHEATIATWPQAGSRNILLAPHLLGDPPVYPGTIAYNGEPSYSPLFVRSLPLLGRSDVEVWSYSRASMQWLRDLGIQAKLVPFAWHPRMLVAGNEKRDVDVLFVGSMSERRGLLMKELIAADFRVQWLFGVYGAERGLWLARSKVCLNVHYSNDGGVEDLRLLLAATSGVCCVSEGEPDEPHKQAWASWAPYGELVARCTQELQGDWRLSAERARKALEGHDALTMLSQVIGRGD